MNKLTVFIILIFLFNNLPLINAQNSPQDSIQNYNRRVWDSVTQFKLNLQIGPGLFAPDLPDGVVLAKGFNYTFDYPNGNTVPSWKSTKSVSIGFQGKINIKNSPVSPYIGAQFQRGFMTIYVMDSMGIQKAESRLKAIHQIYTSAGVSIDFKYISFGGGYGLGGVWGGKLTKSLYPYDLAVINNNQLNWVSHFIHGPELFIGAHYKKFGLYYTVLYGFSQNIGFAQDSKVSFYSNRITLNYTLFDRRMKGKN